jgi:hypothetical protein
VKASTVRGVLIVDARRSARRVDALLRENQVAAAVDELGQLGFLLDQSETAR